MFITVYGKNGCMYRYRFIRKLEIRSLIWQKVHIGHRYLFLLPGMQQFLGHR